MTPYEPERYEFEEEPWHRFELERRTFLQLAGTGLVVVLVGGAASGQRRRGGRMPREISAWLHIDAEGVTTVFTGKVEVGQNIRTSLSQVVAEELRIPVERVRLVMADTARVPYDMGTFGSRTTPVMATQLRRAAAAAREQLRAIAAERWKTDRSKVTVRGGKVVDTATDRSLPLGRVTGGKPFVKTIEEATVARPAEWKVAGKSVPKVDARAFVTGSHQYASDVRLPDMLFGKVVRPDRLDATLESVEAPDATDVVFVRDGNFVGVAAPTQHAADAIARAVKAKWKAPPDKPSSDGLFAYLRNNVDRGGGGRRRGRGRRLRGSIEEGLAAADRVISHSYTVAYIAHAPLEPRAAVAAWNPDGTLTVWNGTQTPFRVRSELARAFGLPASKVRVIVPDTGAGYGGKHSGDCAIEAARLAREAKRPVKLVWSREEEFTWAYFRPAGVIDIKAGATKAGRITAWEHDNYNSGGSSIAPLYDIANQRCQFHRTRYPLRQGSYRALAATANTFARESHVDELAHALGIDSLAFRLQNLTNERLARVLQAAADRFGWGKAKPSKARGIGIAGSFEKGSYSATCAEVAVAGGQVTVERLACAFECGAVLNPNHLREQIEGCAVMGLGGALWEKIDFADGKILNPRFSRYRVPRFSDCPRIDVVALDRRDLPSAGAGETPIITIAPAVGSAIFQATGKRPRSLPMI